MPRARVELDRQAVIAPVRRRTFGSFVEHLGRCVYTGLYEPGHPSANDDGFRMDVVELVRELGSTTVRITSRLASGEVIRPVIEAPQYGTSRYGEVSVLDAIATVDEDRAAVFLVNRDLTQAAQVTIGARSLGLSRIVEATTLADADVYAKNTLNEQYRVAPSANKSALLADGALTIDLPPVSWTAIALR